MATTDHDFEGSIGRISFYKRGDKTIAREKGGPTKEQIKNSPSCQAIRDSNQEFGCASHVCALIRRAIGKDWKAYADTNLIGNLTGELKKMIELGKGPRGARTLDIAAHGASLQGFEFNEHCMLASRFKQPLSIAVSEDRHTAVLQTVFRPSTDIAAPEDATSFQLLYTFMRVPSYGVLATTGRYGPLHDAVLVSEQVTSPMLYTNLALPVKLSLPLTLPTSSAEGCALLCIVGITFYKGKKRMDKEVCSMQVVTVGVRG